MQTFKAYRTYEQDKVVQSRFVDMTVDDLDPGDVIIRTKYSTINYKDALSYNGTGRIMRKFPTVAGISGQSRSSRLNNDAVPGRTRAGRDLFRVISDSVGGWPGGDSGA